MSQSKKAKTGATSLTVTLNNGKTMPLLGLGTFLSKKGEVADAVYEALRVGYRHIDCARAYENEDEVGDALARAFKDGICTRADVFVTSKVGAGTLHEVEKTIDASLAALKLEYLDLMLLHLPIAIEKNKEDAWTPMRRPDVALHVIWSHMEAAVAAGKCRAIGISNYNATAFNDLMNYATIKPAVNQIESHPYLQQTKFIEFMEENGCKTTAYAPLGAPGLRDEPDHGKSYPPLLEHDTVRRIASAHGVTPAQVLIRWSLERGVICIPKSVKATRIAENAAVDFSLNKDDMAELAKLERGERYFTQEWCGAPTFL